MWQGGVRIEYNKLWTMDVFNLHPTKLFSDVDYQTGSFMPPDTKTHVKVLFFKIETKFLFYFLS